MANRRMLNKTVVESDPFFEMPADSQALYMHLVLNADDEGFVGNPETIRRMTGFSKDSLRLLIAKGFLISFQSGVVVVTHWEMQNKIQPSRKTKTIFTDEKGLLLVDEQGKYLIFNNSSEPCQQDADKMSEECQRVADKTSEQVSIGKYSIDKDSIDKSSIELGKYRDSIEKVEDRESIDNRGYGGKKERERKEPNETSCPQCSSPSYPQSQQLTADDIAGLFNGICTTYPTVNDITQYSTALSNSLMFDRYSKADYSTIFQKAEQSSTLKARIHDEESPVDFGWILEHSKEIKDGAFDN
nr:hypothetical protein [uncultured Anaerobutyricum sp.]